VRDHARDFLRAGLNSAALADPVTVSSWPAVAYRRRRPGRCAMRQVCQELAQRPTGAHFPSDPRPYGSKPKTRQKDLI
jgi:hypothetical protein